MSRVSVDADLLSSFMTETKNAMAQYRRDLDVVCDEMRRVGKVTIARYIDGQQPRSPFYRGLFSSQENARDFGLCVLAYIGGAQNLRADLEARHKDLLGGIDAQGGFTVPEAISADLIRLVELFGSFRRNARVVPMSSDTQRWPKRTGGLTVYAPGEANAITKSNPLFEQIQLVAKKWGAITAISNELVADSAIAIGELVAMEIAMAFAAKEDLCGFRGDGTAAYFGTVGVFNHAQTTAIACDAGDVTYAAACKWKYLAKAVGAVPGWALPFARFYFHRTVFWEHVVGQVDANNIPIVKFVTSAAVNGGAGVGAPLQLGGATPLLLGFPVELVDCFPSTADVAQNGKPVWAFGSLYLSWYLGQRGLVGIDQSKDAFFQEDMLGIRGIQRVDFKPADPTGVALVTTHA